MDISVVICTYNRSQSLRETLTSLANMAVPADFSWELIVVDNNSTDNTRAVVEEFASTTGLNIRYVFECTQGLSHARNAGLRGAQGEVIAFTDDDVTVDRNWVQAIYNAFGRLNCAGIGGRIFAEWPCEKPAWFQDEGPYALDGVIVTFDLGESSREIRRAPIGANMAFRKAAFEKHGPFRTDLGRAAKSMVGGEDTEFGRRLLRAGEKLLYVPGAIVYHPVERKRLEKRYFQSWYYARGVSSMREEPPPRNAVYYFGVPRYLFRMLGASLIKWLFAFDRRRRFYHKLAMYRLAGEITEAHRLSNEANELSTG